MSSSLEQSRRSGCSESTGEQGLSVLIIESGPKISRFKPNYAHTAKYHMQENGSMIAWLNHDANSWKRVGGSLINSALSFVAPDEVLDDWARLLDDDSWSADNLRSTYNEISTAIGCNHQSCCFW